MLKQSYKVEQTFALIKPNVTTNEKIEEILKKINNAEFKVIMSKKFLFDDAFVEHFYGEHKHQPWFENLRVSMMSGQCMGLVLERENAINEWRKLIGPTNVQVAKRDFPQSLRALYGDEHNTAKNAFHGSDSETSAKREIAFFVRGSE